MGTHQTAASPGIFRLSRIIQLIVVLTQVILPVPDRSRVTGVCLGGRELDTLFAFCGDKIWKRKVKVHAMGAFTTWTKVSGTKL